MRVWGCSLHWGLHCRPCRCAGTCALVHVGCLNTWRAESANRNSAFQVSARRDAIASPVSRPHRRLSLFRPLSHNTGTHRVFPSLLQPIPICFPFPRSILPPLRSASPSIDPYHTAPPLFIPAALGLFSSQFFGVCVGCVWGVWCIPQCDQCKYEYRFGAAETTKLNVAQLMGAKWFTEIASFVGLFALIVAVGVTFDIFQLPALVDTFDDMPDVGFIPRVLALGTSTVGLCGFVVTWLSAGVWVGFLFSSSLPLFGASPSLLCAVDGCVVSWLSEGVGPSPSFHLQLDSALSSYRACSRPPLPTL